ncbi:VPLPA-CTERM sorting domain-containing protein [Tateyamaria sp. Alg231-49]|uniref:VPLPA-CTERM sorting domain-containing protein n=1 Tax=Tateyamaria sp. Alg231-49 TaxID=1922219 RepID=UPI000D5597D4|nr:VPLPA-CTERM sorting domain-containing protein [Tateyamaria sp. Alg231-49]
MKSLSVAIALSTLAMANVSTSVNAATVVAGDLAQDGYNYVLEAGSGGGRLGDGGPYSAVAGISPGTAYASGSYSCIPSENYNPVVSTSGRCANYQQAYARSEYTYRIEATASDAFYQETGLVGLVQIPLIYNWSVLAEGGLNGGIADASVRFTGGPEIYIREAAVGERTFQAGTHKFFNGTNVRLLALVIGDGRAVADPFGGVDPDWEYAQFASLIDINTSPVIFDSVTDGISSVPLPASGLMLIAGVLGIAGVARRKKLNAQA